ncbi:MAG: hypothetical protein ABJP70_02480 [Erythrobacter sp.]
MDRILAALIWAAIIMASAFCLNSFGLSQGASFGITAGLAGAAFGSIYGGNKACKTGCRA